MPNYTSLIPDDSSPCDFYSEHYSDVLDELWENTLDSGREHGVFVCNDGTTTAQCEGEEGRIESCDVMKLECGDDDYHTFIHTHPPPDGLDLSANVFSPEDVIFHLREGIPYGCIMSSMRGGSRPKLTCAPFFANEYPTIDEMIKDTVNFAESREEDRGLLFDVLDEWVEKHWDWGACQVEV